MEELPVPGTEVCYLHNRNIIPSLTFAACFNVSTGDVEDAPALKALHKYDVFEKEGGVYIRAAEADIKSGQRNPVLKCSISNSDEKVVIVGG